MPQASDDQIDVIPGWFTSVDRSLFRFFLDEQCRQGQRGDLAELGTYLGKSAALIGGFRQLGEVFSVVDLFEHETSDDANKDEKSAFYASLSQARFEENYLRVHGELPVVIAGQSTSIRTVARPNRHRFVHVDASHLYEHVLEDVATAKSLLADSGIVAFDDYRAEHTPGVAGAVWLSVHAGLTPIVLSPMKLYGTWGDPGAQRHALVQWLSNTPFAWEVQRVAGHDVVRVWEDQRLGSHAVDWVPPVLLPVASRVKRQLGMVRARRAKVNS